MKKKITFYKLVGTGNDFIVIDNRTNGIRNRKKLSQTVCQRHTGVGSDGLILLEPSKTADLKMRIFNADGSEAEMCGNGARCAAWMAHHILGLASHITFETIAGLISAAVKRNIVKVQLSNPTDFRDYAPLEVRGGIFYFYFINTGVPHCVIFEDNIDTFPVEKMGGEIRFHPHFQPVGTNVNFVQIKNKNTIFVRTYERGVEAETLACGTGVTASAIISALIEKCVPPVSVITRSGEKLTVHFDMSTFAVTNVFLEGAVQYIYQGHLAK